MKTKKIPNRKSKAPQAFNQMEHEREAIIERVYSKIYKDQPEKLKARWDSIGYIKPTGQLRLF